MTYRLRQGKWSVEAFHKGKRAYDTVDTEEQAKEREVELKAELIRLAREAEAPALAPPPTVQSQVPASWTLQAAVDKTFEVKWKGTKSEAFYRAKSNNLIKFFGADTLLSAITTDAVDGFRSSLKSVGNNAFKKGNSQATINHHLATLSMLFKIAHQRGGVAMKPVFGIKQGRRVRKRWVKEDEELVQLKLLKQWGKADQLDWYVLLIDTGMRPTETKDMTGAWCDFRDGGAIHVLISKTDAGIRSIPMTKRVREVLERRCLTYKHGKLFPASWETFTNQWDETRKEMGLTEDRDFVSYCLRHTFATRLLQRGEDLEVVSKLMGHSSLDQTMEYAKLAAKKFIEAIRRLEPTP
jgi:integrase